MDYRTAIQDVANMSAADKLKYFSVDNSAGDMPDNADDYFDPDGPSKTVDTKTAAESGIMSKMSGPDQPAAEPGEAPGAAKDWTAADFKNILGLSSRSDVGDNFNEGAGATDSDKTKSNPLLGKGYLSDDDFNRLKNDKAFQDLYMKKGGSKAERIKSGEFDWDEMSINHMDAFLDQYGSELKKGSGEKPVYNKSTKLAEAQANVKAYEDVFLPNQGDIMLNKMPDFAQKYSDAYKANLRNDPDYAWKFKGENKQDDSEDPVSKAMKIKFDGAIDK